MPWSTARPSCPRQDGQQRGADVPGGGDKGDELGYVRALRQGPEVCEQAKPMAEFPAERRPEPRLSASDLYMKTEGFSAKNR